MQHGELAYIADFPKMIDDLVSYIELHVQCDLVVPASSGVELFAHIADPVYEICLDKAVYIFVF